MNSKPKVVITSGHRWNYFQWFLLGFYELEHAKKIRFKIKLPLSSRILLSHSHIILFLLNRVKRFKRIIVNLNEKVSPDSYNMEGYVIFPNGKKKSFVVDSADAPYLFDYDELRCCDCYFKMQYPVYLEEEEFHLSESVSIPWSDHKHVNPNITILTARGERKRLEKGFDKLKEKIKPLMVGPRQLGSGVDYQSLKAGFQNYMSSFSCKKEKRFMCYFGNAQGPLPESNIDSIDYDWEADICGYFKDQINHPNEKRAKVASILEKYGEQADARIISNYYSDSGVGNNVNKVIELKDFCSHISKFEYNFNVSGYRMSIPNRFIESFMAGTAIVTDSLSVKWYKPFSHNEVIETVPMGYLRNDDVNWCAFEDMVEELPACDSNKIKEQFNEKWRPDVVAIYMLNTLADL